VEVRGYGAVNSFSTSKPGQIYFRSATALAHPGHEAIGNVLRVEYLFAAGIVIAAALSAWKVFRQRRCFKSLSSLV
jgi:hypothetical protein